MTKSNDKYFKQHTMKKAYTVPSLKSITLASENIICGSLDVTGNETDHVKQEDKVLSGKSEWGIDLWGDADK